MKKSVIFLTTMLVVLLVGMPLFAQRHWNNQSAPGRQSGSAYGTHHEGMGGGMYGGRGGRHGCGIGVNGDVKVGTVSAIDVNANTITVTDSDGKTFKVNVNPSTYICDSTEALVQRNALRANPPAQGNAVPSWTAPKAIQISDVKVGDWVSVSYLNTGTTVLDAARIQVVKK